MVEGSGVLADARPSRKWAYRIRSMSTILINLSSRTAAALNTGPVLVDWEVKVVLL